MALPTAEELERVLVDSTDREPDTQVVDEADWVQVRTPSSPRPNHNVVLRARLGEAEVAARIAAVIGEHRERGAQFRWVVGPSSAPGDLARRLESAGLQPLGHTFGMALRVPEAVPAHGIEGLTVERVGPDDIETLADVTARGFERGEGFRETVAYLSRKQGANMPMWIARLHGEPVASANLRLLTGIGYLQGCAVRPEFRRRGIYRALVHHRLADLRDRGIPFAVVWADASTSAVACGHVGFTRICEADWFRSPERAP